ncbi:MAG: hypothetical protein JWO81_1590 [Alphaproteobacteria bacterium]|nr:hypothetical protein [Alphaproteobacteria bacterium]
MRSMVEGARRARQNASRNRCGVTHDLGGRDSKDGETARAQCRVPGLVPLRDRGRIMCPTVNLDDEARLRTEKVGHIWIQRMLAPEFEPAGPRPKLLPEERFRG